MRLSLFLLPEEKDDFGFVYVGCLTDQKWRNDLRALLNVHFLMLVYFSNSRHSSKWNCVRAMCNSKQGLFR